MVMLCCMAYSRVSWIVFRRVHNCAARLVTRTPLREHITPALQDLHWLPVEYRSSYKILLYTYKALNGQAPVYIKLCDKLTKYKQTRTLRSQSQCLLTVPKGHTETYGDRCLGRAAATPWNSLPEETKCAKNITDFKINKGNSF
jgi:hypothetical protein